MGPTQTVELNPAIEVAAPDANLRDLSLGQATADLKPTVYVAVWF